MGKQIFDRTKKTICIFTLVFFVMSLTAASVSAGTVNLSLYKEERAKLDKEKANLENEKIVILKEKAEFEKEKKKLEAHKNKLNKKHKTDKEYQRWLNNYNNCLSKYNKSLSKYKTWEDKTQFQNPVMKISVTPLHKIYNSILI